MRLYGLFFKNSDRTVMIEEGLYYGQPSPSNKNEFYSIKEINMLLNNEAFVKNILTGLLEIRMVQVNIGEVVQLTAIPPIPSNTKYMVAE